jgi:hypothetical protein
MLLCGLLVATRICSAADSSFVFSAGMQDLANYFPTYLANGYFSVMSGPRGTEATPGYLAAFMDHTPGDVARPAAVPGWTGIDYSTGRSTAGESWMNTVRLDAAHFRDYAQTLDTYDATLTTAYRYVDDAGRQTDVGVTTLVSEAAPHLAATRLHLTPGFTGTIELRFLLTLWAAHQPRFAMARLDGSELTSALTANHLSMLEPVNSHTADRAPIWYDGDIRIGTRSCDRRALACSLNGRAVGGSPMAEAMSIALPDGLAPRAVRLISTDDELGIAVTVDVVAGRTYEFEKYIALSRAGWGGNARATLALADAARQDGFEPLLRRHRDAWHLLWESDIQVEGDPEVQRALHSDLYYLLANSTAGTAIPVAACGLTPNYAGHVFWDSDSWVFPALLLLHPERAKSLALFRTRTLDVARARARAAGLEGSLFPWETDPETGRDETPYFANGVQREIHVNADIALAQWQYYLATGDRDWLRRDGWPVILAVAQFWTSRARDVPDRGRVEIEHVTSPDEAYADVPNDTFTNASASKALRTAAAAAEVLGIAPDPQWRQIASRLYVPFDETAQRHLDFDPSVPHDKTTWMGSSLSWLVYPNLDWPMTAQVRRNDFDYQLEQLRVHGDDPNEMMMVMLAVHAAELGDASAGDWIARNLRGFLKAPFNVRSETVSNNAGYLLSTSAGFVQSILYGLTGLRLSADGLTRAYAPVLPEGWSTLRLRNISLRGRRFDVVVTRRDGRVVLSGQF